MAVIQKNGRRDVQMEDAQTRSECGVIVKRLPSCRAIYNPHVSVSF